MSTQVVKQLYTKGVSNGTKVSVAQLVKPKKFSFLWAILWFLLFGVGLVVYLLYYAGKKDQTVYLEINERGRIKRMK